MSIHRTPRNLLVLGANGLSGSHLLDRLLDVSLVQHVLAPTRQPLPAHPRLENPVGDILLSLQQSSTPVETAFCCLGTTQHRAGSEAAFRAIDIELVCQAARQARRLGARHLIVLSSLGADPHSSLLYARIKGEMEQALIAQQWPQLTIVRPSLLLGPRSEPRPLERLAAPLARLLPGRWQAVLVCTLAHALWRLALEPGEGVRIVESDELRLLGSH